MKIKYYQTEDGYLCQKLAIKYENERSLAGYLLNSGEFKKTHATGWFRVICPHSDELELLSPERIENKLVRYEKLPSAAALPVPEVIEADQLPDGFDSIHDAYKAIYEKVNHGRTKVETEWVFAGSVTWKNVLQPDSFCFKLHAVDDTYGHRNKEETLTPEDILSANSYTAAKIVVDDIQAAMTPSFAWHLGPCSISSDTMYRLIRSHVKENLDGRRATIKSDYEFVFEVHKRLPCKPFKYSYSNPFAKRKRDRVVKIAQASERTQKVLHLTRAGRIHGTEYGAKVVPEMRGENLADLVENIQTYLGDLMAEINAPVRICGNCDGTGIELDAAMKEGQ